MKNISYATGKMTLAASFVAIALCAGCKSPTNTEAIKEHAADATAEVKRDAGAIAAGIKEGLQRKGPLDINSCSSSDLEALPGMTPKQAKAVIAGRPYDDAAQLYKRHVLPKAEYDRIRAQIIAKQ
jgi:DNA uptake protein ComE-like DNA-binding protein